MPTGRVAVASAPNLSLGSSVFAYMQADGAAALAAAVDDLAPHLRDADGECRMGGESRSNRATLIVAAMSDKAIDRIFGELATSPVLRAAIAKALAEAR